MRSSGALWSLVLVALVVTALAVVPGELRRLRSDIEVGGQGRHYRELQPARTVGIQDLRLFVLADATLPADARFYVATGRRYGIEPAADEWVRHFARYWLLPRRLTSTAAEADWVLAYGADPRALGVPVSRVSTIRPGIALAEVER